MPFRISEVIAVLALVGALLLAKHVPLAATLPLSQMAGIVCFAFAIYIALRIYGEELARIRAGD
jgi:heme A synthase